MLLPELVSTDNTRLPSFGRGLADGGNSKQELWQVLRSQLEKTPPEKRRFEVLWGFLSACAESDPEFYHSTLDGLISDNILGEWFPIFQTTATIDEKGVERLHKSLDTGKALIHTFICLSGGCAHESIGDDELAGLLRKILYKEEGIDVVVRILSMRFHRSKENPPQYSNNLIAVAREVLSMYPFPSERRGHNNLDYGLAQIASVCLKGEEGKSTASEICRHLIDSIRDNRIYHFDYPRLFDNLACLQPFVFLDLCLGNDGIEHNYLRGMFSNNIVTRNNPMDQISDDDLISWCDSDPENRYPLIASSIQAFSESTEKDELVAIASAIQASAGSTAKDELAWKPLVYSIFERAPNLDAVLACLADGIRPMSCSGSCADILQKRSVPFQSLYHHDNAEISSWARSQYSKLQEEIKVIREREDRQHRERNESFE